ncbi:PREDICTED: LOW QUALITY PROTEIN: prostaglandin-H2 D-isomerase [Myotis davidii]|uniref:LOW QUALITY PROTEIN: prostaglandin-H2 D-isomerase n=1 Tax=Myotis davidii TaxID=225400 RepID=UPI000766FEA2|nr:PREDICTED: LOW QUALITY PROTEIN: prostaglandin-H2 D-isomerase [Myotis davidii]
MAAPRTLWLALVLLGALGVLQTPAQAQASVQPNFQQDKVRRSPARSPRRTGLCGGKGVLSAPGYVPGKRAAPRPGRWVSTTRVHKRHMEHADTPATPPNSPPSELRTLGGAACVFAAPQDPGWGTRGPSPAPGRVPRLCRQEAGGGLGRQPEGSIPPLPKARGRAGSPTVVILSPDWGSSQDVWVEETDYGEYALLYAVLRRPRSCPGRTQTPRAAVKEKFTTFARAKGFTEEDIVFLPKTDKCLEEQQ